MDDKQFKTFNEKIDKILKLLCLSIVKDIKGDEQVRILYSMGFKGAEIADLLGRDVNAVHQALHRIRKERNAIRKKR